MLEMRGALEAALVRSQMMALTLGQAAGLEGFAAAEIGTYDEGAFGHVFAERPVFATPPATMAAEAGQHIQNGAGVEAGYRLAGYTQEEAALAAQADAVTGIEQ